MYQELRQAISESGERKVKAVCTDSAAGNLKSWKTFRSEFLGVDSIDCVCHDVNLLFHDIKEHKVIQNYINKALEVVKWIRSHHVCKAKPKKLAERAGQKWKQPKLPSNTRSQGHLSMYQFVKDIK